MSIKILWTNELANSKLGYVDFSIEGIDGVFRAANSDGVDMETVVSRIEQNRDFFKYVTEVGASKVIEESETDTNWGNGWEWKETQHPRQAKGFFLSHSTSWFTCPFGDKCLDVLQMNQLHNIQSTGIKLLYSWNGNRQPSAVCYFFPLSVTAVSVA